MICLLAGPLTAPLMASAITLAWIHSVEKIRWEEDWRQGPAGLELVEARVRGSGAGMEPPLDAKFKDGVWRWRPDVEVREKIVLRRSGATEDWQVCITGQCRPMSSYVPADADPVVMTLCE